LEGFIMRGLLVTGRLALAILLVGCAREATQQQAGPKPADSPAATSARETGPSALLVPIEQLLDDYSKNQVDAEKKYKCTLIEVQGFCEPASDGTFYLYPEQVRLGTASSVQCVPKADSKDKAAALQRGQRVKVRGRCSDLKEYKLVMADAVIVEATGPAPALRLSASELTREYAANPEATAQKYGPPPSLWSPPTIVEGTFHGFRKQKIKTLGSQGEKEIEIEIAILEGHDEKAPKPHRVELVVSQTTLTAAPKPKTDTGALIQPGGTIVVTFGVPNGAIGKKIKVTGQVLDPLTASQQYGVEKGQVCFKGSMATK
jgi:hypothetical protein